jgi:hypothetical protein
MDCVEGETVNDKLALFIVSLLPEPAAYGFLAWHQRKYGWREWTALGLATSDEEDCREVVRSHYDDAPAIAADRPAERSRRGLESGQASPEAAAIILPAGIFLILMIALLMSPILGPVILPGDTMMTAQEWHDIALRRALSEGSSDMAAVAQAIEAENAMFAAQVHADKHGLDAANARECMSRGKVHLVMYNPATRRIGTVCEMASLFYIIIHNADTEQEVTAFAKDPERYHVLKDVVDYMERVGYRIP